jgi:nicotinamidase-related amidase
MKNFILVGVDLQNCFIDEKGTLCLKGDLSKVKENIKKIIEETPSKIYKVFTMDAHCEADKELSDHPNFVDTFPRHAMLDVVYDLYGYAMGYAIPWDAQLIDEVKPVMKAYTMYSSMLVSLLDRDVDYTSLIQKNEFDVFSGCGIANELFTLLKSEISSRIVIFGVAVDICVKYAIDGLLERGFEITMIVDASASLNLNSTLKLVDNWTEKGVNFISTEEYIDLIS